ncbi:MAG: hypothetical protein JNG89_01435 [Planctomycetaceae bacterium]|nr:hypothetical protein [Planctomycetaceae bacterium]
MPLPEKPANCKFGGADGKTLYITAQTGLYAVPALVTGVPPMSSGPLGSESVTIGELTLQIPSAWKPAKPSSFIIKAAYEIPAAEGDMDPGILTVSGPIGGDDAANIARWVGQFEGDGRESTTSRGTCPQGEYVVVQISGTFKKTIGSPRDGRTEPAPGYRMLGAILKLKDGNYFLKLTGPEKTVAGAADAFRAAFGGDVTQETRELQ